MSEFADRWVDGQAYARIDAELSTIERAHGVQVLVAIESGSRAWRFPSRDSDYDVRFLYMHPIESYLAVSAWRDVIERPIDATLDVNGWDLRKAFQLLLKSNAVLIEWLCSPVRYRERGTVASQMLELARSSADLTALAYHYDRQARRSFEEVTAAGAVRAKDYCYALRSALALLWLRRHADAPPMDLPSLLAGLSLGKETEDVIAALVARKAESTERDTVVRKPVLDRQIGEILDAPVERAASNDRRDAAIRADGLFASIVLEEYAKRLSPMR